MAQGLAKLPFRSFAMNAVWMQLVLAAQDILGYAKALTLSGELAKAKPQTPATGCCTRRAASLARAGAPGCVSPATGPGRPTLRQPASAWTPCPCRRGEFAGSWGQTRRGRVLCRCANRLGTAKKASGLA